MNTIDMNPTVASTVASNDIRSYLDSIHSDILRIQCEKNVSLVTQHLLESMKLKLLSIAGQLDKSQIPLAIAIANGTRDLYKEDSVLSTVLLEIINQKRIYKPDAIAHLKVYA